MVIDILLSVISLILIISGIVGCFLPVLPGPPVSFLGLLILHFTSYAHYGIKTLLFLGLLAIIVQIVDFIVPVWGTKRFGGTRAGIRGSTIGLVIGIIILPMLGIVIGPFGLVGILAGPFVGALIGEIIHGQQSDKAFRAAFGSFIGFLTGTFIKLVTSIIITVYYIREIWVVAFG